MPIDVAADVIANVPLSPDYNVLSLAAPTIAGAAEPGQFVMVKAARGWDPLLRRPFSIFEVLRDRSGAITGLSLLNKRIGPSSKLLYAARTGDSIACLGPLGNSWPPPAAGGAAYLVAGGVGLAAFATFAAALRARGIATTLFYGARTGGELFYLDFFRDRGIELVLTTEDGSVGERGRVTAPLDRRLATAPSGARPTVYACGPDPMMAAVSRLALRARVPCFVSMERIMGCGMGGCYSCVVPLRDTNGAGFHHVRSCLAGPVLDGAQVIWE